MSKFDYTIEVCLEKIKKLHQEITVVYKKQISNEDQKEWVSQIWKKIDELNLAIWTIKRY